MSQKVLPRTCSLKEASDWEHPWNPLCGQLGDHCIREDVWAEEKVLELAYVLQAGEPVLR
jgi:hypothetical protein